MHRRRRRITVELASTRVAMDELIVDGRPDLRDHTFGKTRIKKHPKYVYSTSGGAMLVHRIKYVTAYWYDTHYSHLIRRQTPKLVAKSFCQNSFFLNLPKQKNKFSAVACEIPAPDAVLCGACHGQPRPFGKYGKPPCTKELAQVRLGCLVRGKQTSK